MRALIGLVVLPVLSTYFRSRHVVRDIAFAVVVCNKGNIALFLNAATTYSLPRQFLSKQEGSIRPAAFTPTFEVTIRWAFVNRHCRLPASSCCASAEFSMPLIDIRRKIFHCMVLWRVSGIRLIAESHRSRLLSDRVFGISFEFYIYLVLVIYYLVLSLYISIASP